MLATGVYLCAASGKFCCQRLRGVDIESVAYWIVFRCEPHVRTRIRARRRTTVYIMKYLLMRGALCV